MGSPEDEPGRQSNETLHHVTLTEGFWLGETTVTQALWLAVMGKNPSKFKASGGEQLPVESVSWNDCQGFMGKLKSINSLLVFSFPTEAQWEYACRAGAQTRFNTGEVLIHEQANFDNRIGRTVDVHRYAANAWGLKQMYGNVWEWCGDSRRQYLAEPEVDPIGRVASEQRALRGGSWIVNGVYCRSAYREEFRYGNRSLSFSFRLAGF